MHRKRCEEKPEETGRGHIEDRHDMEWRVEQKLARVLAERDTYVGGFIYGFLTALCVGAVIAFALYPEMFTRKVN